MGGIAAVSLLFARQNSKVAPGRTQSRINSGQTPRVDRLTDTDPARTLKSDVVSELEAISRAAKWDWACATGRAVISLQHDGVVIVPLPRDHGNEEELRRDLRRVSSAALGYDQPVEIKPMTDGADPNPVRDKLAPAWATNLGACVAGRVGPQEGIARA